MSVLLVLPWFAPHEGSTFDGFQLVAYARGEKPGPAGSELQKSLDDTTVHFVSYSDQPIGSATLLRIDGEELIFSPSESQLDQVGLLAELVAFAGLSHRDFFAGHTYCNKQTFQLAIQPFGPIAVGIRSRRRDGASRNIIPVPDYRARRPDGVSVYRSRLDEDLLNSLLVAESSSGKWAELIESIVSFNLANTDSTLVYEGTEAVLLISAFERLLGCRNGREQELAEAFADAWSPSSDLDLQRCQRIPSNILSARFRNSATIRDVWVRDFFRLRGNLAHGMINPRYPALWSLKEHLLLGTFLFPFVLKSLLVKEGIYSLTSWDKDLVDVFERLACEHHFRGGSDTGDERDRWNAVISDSLMEKAFEDNASKKRQVDEDH